jgi:hypothetical protein
MIIFVVLMLNVGYHHSFKKWWTRLNMLGKTVATQKA